MSRGTVNKVTIIGNVGQEPDVRATQNGTQIVNLTLATDDSYRDRQSGQMVPQTDWHRVVLIGKVAEVAAQYVTKGQKLYVEGKLKTRKWQGQDGQDRYTTEIVVDMKGTMEMLGGNASDQGNSQPSRQPSQPRQQQAQQPGAAQPEPAGAGGGTSDFDDDIPFHPYMKGIVWI